MTMQEYMGLVAKYPNAEGFPAKPDGTPPDFCGCPTQCSTGINWGVWKPLVNGYDPCTAPGTTMYNCWGGNSSGATYSGPETFVGTGSPDCPGMSWISWSFEITISCDKQGNYIGSLNSLWSWGGGTGSRCRWLFNISTDLSGTPQTTNYNLYDNIDPRYEGDPCSTPDPNGGMGASIPGPFPCKFACPTEIFGSPEYPQACCDVTTALPENTYWIRKCDTPPITWTRR